MSDMRTWTDVHNRQVEAVYVASTAANVTIRIMDGTEFIVDLENLSTADRQFVREAAAK